MPNILTLFVFFSISLFSDSFGQDYGWKVGVSGGPNLRNLHVKNRLLWEHPWINEDSKEFSLLAWDIGLTLEKTINERWSISSGAFFLKKGYETITYPTYDLLTDDVISKNKIELK